MTRLLALLLVLTACSDARVADAPIRMTGSVERYGFVATLGRDTVSVERIARSANALVSDGVERFPMVRLRHTEIELAPDGRLVRLLMQVRTPSGATPDERSRTVRATFTGDSVKVTIERASGVTGRSFATGGALTVPHVSMQYSVIELEIASAMRRAAGDAAGGELPFRQFYPDRDIGPSFVLHHGAVHPLGDGKVELHHDWLSGYGDVTVDSGGRMLAYSGQRSTYKVRVVRSTALPDVEAVGAAFTATEQRSGAKRLSVRDTARGTVGPAAIAVVYGRPLARGRVLLGDVIAYDRVWRTGANEATQLTTSAPIVLAGLVLPAGSYTLWTVPRRNGVDLIVNRQTGQWGTGYDARRDLGQSPMQAAVAHTPVEEFTISIRPTGANTGALVLAWGTFRWTAPVVAR